MMNKIALHSNTLYLYIILSNMMPLNLRAYGTIKIRMLLLLIKTEVT